MQLSLLIPFLLAIVVLIVGLVMTLGKHRATRTRLVGASMFVLSGALFNTSACFRGFHYKSGTMRCSVQQVDQEGIWSRTWEAVLVTNTTRRQWHVSIVNDAPANMLREAMQAGRDVLVHYDEFRMRGWMLGSSEVVVTHVEGI